MKRLMLLALLLSLLVPFGAGHAQETDIPDAPCAAEDVSAAVDRLLDGYDVAAATDSTPADALTSLNLLRGELDALYAACNTAQLSELLGLLQGGGYVVYVRHTETDRSQSDTGYASCETQRNLNEAGRQQARDIGQIFPSLGIPVGQLISTQLCRTRETAELAFGEPQIITRESLEEAGAVQSYLSAMPAEGQNTLLVAHIGTIRRAIGLPDIFEEGDSFIFLPDGEGNFSYIGRIGLDDWAVLAELAAQ